MSAPRKPFDAGKHGPSGSIDASADGSKGLPSDAGAADAGCDPSWFGPDAPHWPIASTEPGAAHAQSFTYASGGKTVKDNVTGLVWQRGFSDDLHSDAAVADWEAAAAYCDALTLEGKSFRVPTATELLSTVDFTHSLPAIDTVAFPGTPDIYFLASSPLGSLDRHSLVSFDFGYVQNATGSIDRPASVRCVEKTKQPSSCSGATRYVAADGVVVDHATGLAWEQGHAADPKNHADAAAYCASLDLDGKGFRLPTYAELASLITWSGDPFPGQNDGYHWVSTPFAGDPSSAWIIQGGLSSNGVDVSTLRTVKCVR